MQTCRCENRYSSFQQTTDHFSCFDLLLTFSLHSFFFCFSLFFSPPLLFLFLLFPSFISLFLHSLSMFFVRGLERRVSNNTSKGLEILHAAPKYTHPHPALQSMLRARLQGERHVAFGKKRTSVNEWQSHFFRLIFLNFLALQGYFGGSVLAFSFVLLLFLFFVFSLTIFSYSSFVDHPLSCIAQRPTCTPSTPLFFSLLDHERPDYWCISMLVYCGSTLEKEAGLGWKLDLREKKRSSPRERLTPVGYD